MLSSAFAVCLFLRHHHSWHEENHGSTWLRYWLGSLCFLWALTEQNPGFSEMCMLVSCRKFVIHEDDRMNFLLAIRCHPWFACWCCHLSGYKSLGCREMSLNLWEYFSLNTKLKIYKHVVSSERQSLAPSYLGVAAAWNMSLRRNNPHPACSKL